MEVYKITNKVNGKVYIGGTRHSKEERWIDHKKFISKGVKKGWPLYIALDKYGVDTFTLETIEEHTDYETNKERETYWIQKYWESVGEENIYNLEPFAYGSRNPTHLHTEESQKKAAQARAEKYGAPNGAAITPEAIDKMMKTKMERYGTLAPPPSKEGRESKRIKTSAHFKDIEDDELLIGYIEVKDKLNSEGYDFGIDKIKKNMINPNKTFIREYPELLGRFERLN